MEIFILKRAISNQTCADVSRSSENRRPATGHSHRLTAYNLTVSDTGRSHTSYIIRRHILIINRENLVVPGRDMGSTATITTFCTELVKNASPTHYNDF
jgi:hypothetical protein